MVRSYLLAALLCLISTSPLVAGRKGKKKKVEPAFKSEILEGMNYRLVGPFRGGRSAAVTGVPGKPTTFYFGSTGGGVWRTQDGGSNWENLSDGYFGGSIGAVAVSEWDPNVIYVGGGEKTVRGNVSSGYGIYKSLDGGKTWQHKGLADSRHIPRIRIHPKNPDIAYAAVLGHLYGPNDERGIFRTKDGGESWQRIHFVNNESGAVDLCMDPTNPRNLFATFWRIKRTPYSLESGGEGSSLWHSTDGGDTWTDISANEGLPQGTLGIIGVTVSKADPNRIWAIIEAEEGGVFRSDDGGKTWSKVNEERSLRQRAWYYTRIYADTKDPDTVYVLNVRFWKSTDGGKTFSSIDTPHGDHHDLWIDPNEPERMIIGDDGGAQITFDGGTRWSTYHNQPTAQFYRVTTDNHFPYRIYAAQQDNSTVRIAHRTTGSVISEGDWEATAGGESGHIAPDPENPDIVYGGSYGGYLTRYDHSTGEMRQVQIWPDNPMGHGAADLKWRFQWNFPIFFSPNDPDVLYAAGNALFKSTNEGQSWEAISPDLTRNDKEKQGPSGGPITKDNTSVEYYCTIFAAAESHLEPGLIWTGSDDGVVSLTRDGGQNWQQVTPPDLPEWTQINSIEVHPTKKGALYLAGTRYKLDDFAPYLYKTEDYGKTWTRITEGIDPTHFTRVIRADPGRDGLLYAGTETGMYISFDDGASWQNFQLNLPIVPITDLTIKDNDLVVATQGRSLWVLDDLTPLHQLELPFATDKAKLFEPRTSWRIGARTREDSGNNGTNLPGGVLVHFYLPEEPATAKDKETEKVPLSLIFKDANGETIRTFSSDLDEKKAKGDQGLLKAKKGINRFAWDMRYPAAREFDGMILWSGNMNGPMALPGEYSVTMTYDEESSEATFEIVADPRSTASEADLEAQFTFIEAVRNKLDETHAALARIRSAKGQIDRLIAPMKDREPYKEVVDSAKELVEKLEKVEQTLYQTKNQSRQDPLNFPIRLNDRLAGVKGVADVGTWRPTDQAVAVKDQLVAEIDEQLTQLETILSKDLTTFNELVRQQKVPAIWLEEE